MLPKTFEIEIAAHERNAPGFEPRDLPALRDELVEMTAAGHASAVLNPLRGRLEQLMRARCPAEVVAIPSRPAPVAAALAAPDPERTARALAAVEATIARNASAPAPAPAPSPVIASRASLRAPAPSAPISAPEYTRDGATMLANPGETREQYQARKAAARTAEAAPINHATLSDDERESVRCWKLHGMDDAACDRVLRKIRAQAART